MKILGFNIAREKTIELAKDKKEGTSKKSRRKLSSKILQQRKLNVDVEMEILIQALNLAEDIERPDRKPLYTIYDKVIKRDSHLRSQLRTAHFTVQQSIFKILKDEKENEVLKKLFESSWFTDFITYAIDQEFWGHSLVEFGLLEEQFKDVILIDRLHVIPEFQSVLKETTDDVTDGIPYGKNLNNWFLVEIGNKRDLGLLLTACFEIVYKKDARGDWSAFNERFGLPLLSITTDTSNEDELDELENMAMNFGSQGYVIGSKETEFDVKQANGTENGHIKFKDKAEMCDDYISKLINGQTATSDNQAWAGTSNVQERVLNTYTKGRLQRIQRVINDKLIPFLIYHGYPLDGAKFQYVDLLQKEKIETVTDKETEKKKSKLKELSADLYELYSPFKQTNNIEGFAPSETLNLASSDKFKEIFDKLTKKLHTLASKDKLPKGSALLKEGEELLKETALVFEEAIGKGIELAKYTPDIAFKEKLTKSVWVFSGFKTDRQLKDISKLLYADGQLKPFNKFRDEVLKLDKTYNTNWLQTEYNQAVSATQSAVKWNKFEQNGDKYYLQYRTAGDERVRTPHANINKVTLPVSDSFWDEHFSPNGWGCRCLVVEVLKSQYDETSQEDVKEKSKNIFPTENDKIFAYNPGKTAAPFPPKHPYYKVQNSLATIIENQASKLFFTNVIKKQLNEFKKDIDTYKGKVIVNKNIQTGRLMLLKRSVKDVIQHNNNLSVRSYILRLEDDIKNWEYKGWVNVEAGKHKEAVYFLYYSTKIDGVERFLNIKIHKSLKAEVLYAILDKIDLTTLKKGLPTDINKYIKR